MTDKLNDISNKDEKKIKVLEEKFKEKQEKAKILADQKQYIEAQNNTLIKLQQELESKQNEINHLKAMLDSMVPVLETQKEFNRPITDEEAICITQLSMLKKDAMTRPLTIDEVRILDTLVKNLRLLQGASTENTAPVKLKDVTQSKLLEIASYKDKKE